MYSRTKTRLLNLSFKSFKGLTCSSEDEGHEHEVSKQRAKKSKVDGKFSALQKKHLGRWPDYKIRAWANMLL